MQSTRSSSETAGTQMSKSQRIFLLSPKTHRWLLCRTKELVWSFGFGSLFLFAQSYALSIQNLQLNSALGEPLDAIIHIVAAPGELLTASCIAIRPGADDAIPALRGVKLSLSPNLSPGTIRLTSRLPMREPMSEMIVQVDCPGAPRISRSFLVMLDPPVNALDTQIRQQSATANAVRTASRQTPSTRPVAAITSSDSRVRVTASVPLYDGAHGTGQIVTPGLTYTVENGDTLSTIAARIEGRDRGTVWNWAATIQSANPQAFINGNPNELIAGSTLYLPTALTRGLPTLQLRTESSSDRQANQSSASDPTYDDRRVSSTTTDRTGAATRTVTSADNATAGVATASLSNGSSQTAASASAQSILAASQAMAAYAANTRARGQVMSVQPVFVLARKFSAGSIEKLQMRKAGLIQSLPDPLAQGGSGNDPGEQIGETDRQPAIPVDDRPAIAIAPATAPRKFSALGILGGLSLLVLSFLAGLFFASRRHRRTVEETVNARLRDARYHQRVQNDHRDVADKVLAAGASGIEVTEDSDTSPEETTEYPVAETSEDEASVDEADDMSIELNLEEQHALTAMDLELLEQDYADQKSSFEEIASAGRGSNRTVIMKSSLDLVLPEDDQLLDDPDPTFGTLEFEEHLEGDLDFDLGPANRGDKTQDDTGLDFTEAAAELDAQLQSLQDQDTSELPHLEIEPSEDDITRQSTRDAEEFYHLEASAIMNVGELSFEQDQDDETNILKFRQRNMKTGTDDTGGDDD